MKRPARRFNAERILKCLTQALGFSILVACGDSGPTDPQEHTGVTDVRWESVATGMGAFWDYSCGLTDTGAAYCWGDNTSGQRGDASPGNSRVPVRVEGGQVFGRISAGWRHTCALTMVGAAYCWGDDNWWGDQPLLAAHRPRAVPGGLTFRRLAAGNFYTCGIEETGAAYCWSGEFPLPTRVGGGHNFTEISGDRGLVCAVAADGAVYCWDYWPTDRPNAMPVRVASESSFAAIAVGDSHACAITRSGAAYCWGNNTFGQLGNPTLSSGGSGFVASGYEFTAISAGERHTCALTKAGVAYCWGWNDLGQLGNGGGVLGNATAGMSRVPVSVSGGLTFASISSRGSNNCAIAVGGVAYCWGLNSAGQLGDGSEARSAPYEDLQRVPTRVKPPRA